MNTQWNAKPVWTLLGTVIIAGLLLLASCAPLLAQGTPIPNIQPAELLPTSSPPAEETPASPMPAVTPSKENPFKPIDPVAIAIMDLARRLGVDPGAIRLVSLQPDEFPASDLGCPVKPGESKPMDALVTGQVITLGYQDQTYIYHADRSRAIYCGP